MKNLSKGQIFTLILTSGVFFVFSFRCASNFSELIGTFFNSIIVLLLFSIAVFASKGKRLNAFGSSLMLAALLCAGSSCVINFFNAEKSADFGINHKIYGAVLLGCAVIYCASLGLSAAARCSGFIFAATAVSVLLLIVGGIKNLDLSRIRFSFDFDLRTSMKFCINIFSHSSIAALGTAVIVQSTVKKSAKPAIFATLSIAALNIVLSLLACFALGADSPTFFELAKYTQPFSVQSGEWIYIVNYGMLSVLTLSLSVHLAADRLDFLIPKLKFKTTICAFVVFALCAAMSQFDINTNAVIVSSNIIAAVASCFWSRPKTAQAVQASAV